MSQSSTKAQHKWIKVLETQTAIHEVDEMSIMQEGKSVYYFVHRGTYKTPRVVEGVRITHMITINAINCSNRLFAFVSDAVFDGDKMLAQNIVTKEGQVGTPQSGSPQYIMMNKLCGYPPDYT
jgi:hypothetical protein